MKAAAQDSDNQFEDLLALMPRITAYYQQAKDGAPIDDDTLASAVIRAAYSAMFIKPFDWISWKKAHFPANLAHIASMDFDTLRKLMTMLVRQDRFVEGSLNDFLYNGVILQILQRLAQLVEEGCAA